MINTPLAERQRIVLIGPTNSGKSSLINNIFEREISIVSDVPGTTTDPVTRMIEMAELGPIAVSDTAGFDDSTQLGEERVKKTISRLNIADIIIFVTRADKALRYEEKEFISDIKKKNKKIIIALTFSDKKINNEKTEFLKSFSAILIDNLTKKGINEIKNIIIKLGKTVETEITPLEGLVNENDIIIFVTPIDLAAPKGRLILPQVESIRDALDKDCASVVVKERELKFVYDSLKIKPKLVVTDSQAFNKVAADIPPDQMLTSFSILFARKKGDLQFFIEGVRHIKDVSDNPQILILESCAHHRQADDIGTVKIPRLFRQLVNPNAKFSFAKAMPDNIEEFDLVINCANCMKSRNFMLNRIQLLKDHNIYAVNYGLFLAWVNGLLPRALEPFPYEYNLYKDAF